MSTKKETKATPEAQKPIEETPSGCVWTDQLQEVLKRTDLDIMKRLELISFDTDMLINRDKAIQSWLPNIYDDYSNFRFSSIINSVLNKTGGTPDQLLNPDQRTQEQADLFKDELYKEAMLFLDILQESRFMQALTALQPVKGIYQDPAEDQSTNSGLDHPDSVKQQAILFFFAIHTDKAPSGRADLTESDIEELKKTFGRLDQYYYDRTNGGDLEPTEQIFFDFIEHESVDAGQIITALPKLKAVTLQKHTMPNNKLANTLPKDIINTGAYDLIVGRSRSRDITSYVMATLEETPAVKMTGKPYTQYDRSVMDAIVSIWLYGDQSHIVTPDMIYRTMNHKTETEYVSPQQRGAVTRSIEKIRRIHVTIDASEEMRKCKAVDADGNPVTSFKYDDFLLTAQHIEVEAGGKTVNAYKINSEPILLTYSRMTRQLLTVNAKYLDVKEVDKAGKLTKISLPNTEQRIPVRDYILRRILAMKNDRKNERGKQSNHILFETLFAETGVNATDRTITKRTRQYIFQVLDFYKASGFIDGYQIIKEGRSIKGVEIAI